MLASPGAIAFELGPVVVRWYGILTAVAIAVGLWLVTRQTRAQGLPEEQISSCVVWGIVTGYIGARLYEVAFNWDYYGRNWAKIPAVWEGGLAVHGGLLVGCSVAAGLAAWRRLPVLRILDIGGPSLAIAQAIGRWGNFFNEEAFGRPTDLPWRLYISPRRRPPEYQGVEFFHPTFLYESLWDLAVFAALVLWLRSRWRDRPGALFFWYIGLYSVGRFAIESLRLDSFWVGGYRVPQLASLVGIAISICGLLWVSRRARGGTSAARSSRKG
jgi:phosphatidylglycerol:prolipoprotein diacylglycerol transferase